MDYIICHYGEISLKGKNRRFFEEKLVGNIKKTLKRSYFSFIKRISGRILIRLTEKGKSHKKEVFNSLRNVFGIANFALAQNCQLEIEKIKEKALEILKKQKFKTFKISTQRSDKKFPLTSQQINERVGEYLLRKLKAKSEKRETKKIKVDLEKPELTVFIEIVEGRAFLYLEKIPGPGGLPLSTGGRAVALLSGGIDSPVASFFVMKRGVRVIFLHFHAYPFTKKASIEKTKKIVKVLNKFQFESQLFLVPFWQLQKEIVLKTPPKLRMILYRRAMAKISQEIAKKEKATALVTGESIGQVASQTLENIRVIDEAVKLPIFRPLIGFDKEEIIKKAKQISTFDISILPQEDCCSRFLPKHPETKAELKEVKTAEKKIPLKALIKATLAKTKVIKV